MSVRLAPAAIALAVIAGVCAATPTDLLPRSEHLVTIAGWLPSGDGSLLDGAMRARLAFGAICAVAAWAALGALALSSASGVIAGSFAACLLMGSPAWSGASWGPAIATAAALGALAAGRRLAVGGAAYDAAHEAVAACVAAAIAALFEPGYAALSIPLVVLWWLRVGRRSGLGQLRTAAGRAQAVGLLLPPAISLGALIAVVVRWPSEAALLWPGWSAGGAPLPDATAAGAARALAEMLGPTAVVAALGGSLALLLPARAHAPASEAQPGPWTFALLLAMALGGAVLDVARGATGVASASAVALATGVALQRLAQLAVVTTAGETQDAPPRTFGAGAILVALTGGFLILAPSLLY
jgi:hypothetical protein